VPAKELLEMVRHSDPETGAYLSGYVNIAIASLRVKLILFGCKGKEPLHALPA
jgi:hypothetical protein